MTELHTPLSLPDGTTTNEYLGIDDVPEWTLGDRMRRALRHSNISVADMATDLGVSVATLGRWLNDRGPVKRSYLRLWALTTGVSLEWLETGALPRLDSNQQPFGYLYPLVSGLGCDQECWCDACQGGPNRPRLLPTGTADLERWVLAA